MRKWLIVLCSLLCTSCMPPEKIIEMQGVSTIVGYDLLDEDSYKGTISLLQFDRQQEKTSVTLSAVGSTSKQIRQKLEQKTSHDITSGQLRTILFNREMAEIKGISSFLDTMQRDTSIGSLVFLAITENAQDTINNQNFEEYPEMGSYIYQLLDKHEKKEMLVNSSLHDFISTLYEAGIDPTLPIIKNDNKVAPFIDGVALFNDDKMVGSIPLINTLYIKLFRNRDAFLGDITLEFPSDIIAEKGLKVAEKPKSDKYKVTVHPIKYTGEIVLTNEEAVTLSTTISVSLIEAQPPTNLKTKESVTKWEQIIEEKLNKEFGDILQQLKELNTDPIGIGRKIKSIREYSHLDDEELNEKYLALQIQPKIKVKIIRYGAID